MTGLKPPYLSVRWSKHLGAARGGSQICTLQKAFIPAAQPAYLGDAASPEPGEEPGLCGAFVI